MIGCSDIMLSGKALSKIAFGTHKFVDGIYEIDYCKLLDTYALGGGNLIDTARAYQNGESEKC